MTFEDRFNIAHRESNKSVLSIGLDPTTEVVPPNYKFVDWASSLIEETYKVAPVYKANLSCWLGYGGDYDSLKKICKLVQDKGRIFILDAKVNDVSHTAREYTQRYLKDVNADAVTVNPIPFLNDIIEQTYPFMDDKAIFVLNYTTSPNSEIFLFNSRISNLPMWQFISLKVANEWSQKIPRGEYSPIAIVAAPRDKGLASKIRSICDTQYDLVPGLGPQGVPLTILPYLKKKNAFSPGIITNVGRDVIGAWRKHPDEDMFILMRKKAEEWVNNISDALNVQIEEKDLELPKKAPQNEAADFHEDAYADYLVNKGYVGIFSEPIKLASGEESYWYVDHRSAQQTFSDFDEFTDYITKYLRAKKLDSNILVGVPESATLPAIVVNRKLGHKDFIYLRSSIKSHGVSGKFPYSLAPVDISGRSLNVLEDTATTGDSAIITILHLIEGGASVDNVIVSCYREDPRWGGLLPHVYIQRHLDIPVHYMTSATKVLSPAIQKSKASERVIEGLKKEYRDNPELLKMLESLNV